MQRGGGQADRNAKARQVYEAHLPSPEVGEKVRDGRVFTGFFRTTPNRRKVAYGTCREIGALDVVIDDERHHNRAIHGDLVALELYPQAEWVPFSSLSAETETRGGEEEQGASDGSDLNVAINESLWLPNKALIANFRSSKPASVTASATAAA